MPFVSGPSLCANTVGGCGIISQPIPTVRSASMAFETPRDGSCRPLWCGGRAYRSSGPPAFTSAEIALDPLALGGSFATNGGSRWLFCNKARLSLTSLKYKTKTKFFCANLVMELAWLAFDSFDWLQAGNLFVVSGGEPARGPGRACWRAMCCN